MTSKTEFALGRNRFLELKYFCLQYREWQLQYCGLNGWSEKAGKNEGDKTSRDGIKRADLMRNMRMVSDVCHRVSPPEYEKILFRMVTEGTKPLLTRDEEDFWYYYRKFFWVLSLVRG